jgi:hypothetical protein
VTEVNPTGEIGHHLPDERDDGRTSPRDEPYWDNEANVQLHVPDRSPRVTDR